MYLIHLLVWIWVDVAYTLGHRRPALQGLSLLESRQYAPPIATCTEASFGNPLWYIKDFAYPTSNGGSPSFNLLLNALGESVSCGRENSDSSPSDIYWHPCSGPPGRDEPPYYHYDQSTRELRINQTWTCNDRNPDVSITFSALGQKNMPVCADRDCDSVKTRINGTLYQPFPITPVIDAAPRSHNTPGCTKNSQSPSWTVSNFRSEERMISEWTGGYTLVYFNLTSHVLNTTIPCAAGTTHNAIDTVFDLVHVWNKCDYPGDFYAINHYGTYTYGAFDKGNGSLLLNQTWQCDDEGVDRTFQFDWTAAETIPMTCNSSGTPNVAGYRKNCTAPTFSLTHKWSKSVTKLPTGALDRPKPVDVGASCTIESLVNQYFQLHGGSVYHRRPDGYSERPELREGISVYLIVPGRNGPKSMRGTTFQPLSGPLGNGAWVNCTVDEYYKADTVGCAFRYDNATKHLDIEYAWPCYDKDPNHPITFRAVAGVTLPWKCTEVTGKYHTEGEWECVSEYGAPDVTFPFDKFTWSV